MCRRMPGALEIITANRDSPVTVAESIFVADLNLVNAGIYYLLRGVLPYSQERSPQATSFVFVCSSPSAQVLHKPRVYELYWTIKGLPGCIQWRKYKMAIQLSLAESS